MKLLLSMDRKINGLEKRLVTLETLDKKVDKFDQELKKLWNHVHDNVKRLDSRVGSVEDKVESADFATGLVNDKVIHMEKQCEVLREEIVYLQSQSMRNNLVFGNISEAPTETPHDCEKVLRDFMLKEMKLAEDLVSQIKFDRVHRMGKQSENRSRRIIAKFTEFKEREFVRKQWKSLQGTPYFITEQFPKEVNDKRKELMPKLKAARSEGKRAWLAYDKLYVDGKLVDDK
ncbi:uncharacterized protein LOC128551939 [Mercenaria mercenaria]|uniref:uncharacterized protein LOC128551939 n=1 Tax=Mercenaria mercenaria TaxID=6596 RepID=UPI00234ED4C4|nr:uncharacterized protein LOC128551939 [Mercenaria mercenaria]